MADSKIFGIFLKNKNRSSDVLNVVLRDGVELNDGSEIANCVADQFTNFFVPGIKIANENTISIVQSWNLILCSSRPRMFMFIY